MRLFRVAAKHAENIRKFTRQLGLFDSPSEANASSLKARENDPKLFALWVKLQQLYFPGETALHEYKVIWSSRRQKRVLASCNIRQKLVRVARELKPEDYQEWLSPLLYHEMCHAVLDPKDIRHGRKIRWHGPEFRSLESRHPNSKDLTHWIRNGGWQKAVRSERARTTRKVRAA